MKKIGLIGGFCMIAGATLAGDAIPDYAIRVAGPYDPSLEFFIPAEKAETLAIAEWEVTGPRGTMGQISWGEESVAKAPVNASKYVQKTYSFPTGMIRVLDFKQASGGMYHVVTSETGMYMLSGAGSVEVAGKMVEVGAGDMVSYPSGVLRGSGDATVILWTVRGSLINEAAAATLVREADAPMTKSAEWQAGGKRVRSSNPDELAAAPADAIRLDVKRYEFPGNSVRVTRNYKGGPTSPSSSKLDALIYVTSGQLKFTQDGSEVIANPGDAIREIAGATHFWHRLEDSSFVATSSLPVVPAAK